MFEADDPRCLPCIKESLRVYGKAWLWSGLRKYEGLHPNRIECSGFSFIKGQLFCNILNLLTIEHKVLLVAQIRLHD